MTPHPARHVAQIEETGCGAAALAMVLGAWGRPAALPDLSAACDVGRDGIAMSTLLRVGEASGLTGSARRVALTEAGLRALCGLPGPALALVRGGHYVVIDGLDRRGRVIVLDPAGTRSHQPADRFLATFAGVALVFTGPGEPTVGQRRAPRHAHIPRPPRGDAHSGPALVRRWWTEETTADRGRILGSAVAAAISATATVAAALSVRGLAAPGAVHGPPLAIAAAAAAVAVLAGWTGRALAERTLTRTSTRRSTALVHALLARSPEFFHRRQAGELATRPQRIDGAAMTMTDLLTAAVGRAITLAGLSAALLVLAPTATAVLVAGCVAVALIGVLGRLTDRSLAEAEVAAGAARDAEMLTGLVALETVVAEACADLLIGRWTAASERQRAVGRRVAARAQGRARLSAMVGGWALLAALTVVTVPSGALLAFVLLAVLLQQTVLSLTQSAIALRPVAAAMRLADDVWTGPALSAPADAAVDRTVTAVAPGLAVQCRGVTFGHQRFRAPLLTDLDLRVSPGETVFVTGPSGGGKSTICTLLTGAQRPWLGELTVAGRPPALGDRDVRLVPQRAVLVRGTVRDNLLLARDLADPALWEALRLVELDRVVLDRGGLLAPVDEDGRNFSGGERQRIALARALADPPALLVLDEATSNLERPLEERIMARLRALDLTLVVVAHRVPTLAPEDRVLALREGALETVTPVTEPAKEAVA